MITDSQEELLAAIYYLLLREFKGVDISDLSDLLTRYDATMQNRDRVLLFLSRGAARTTLQALGKKHE
jgi:hypothetical protein